MVGEWIYAFCVVAMFCSVAYAWLKGRVENKRKRIVLAIVIGVLVSAAIVGVISLFLYIVAFRK